MRLSVLYNRFAIFAYFAVKKKKARGTVPIGLKRLGVARAFRFYNRHKSNSCDIISLVRVRKEAFMVLGKIEDLLVDIGSMLKRERLYQNLSQKAVSERSGISESALKNLEGGCGASLSTFIQVCRTLGKDEWIMRLGPADAVSVEDYAKRGGRPRVRAAASRKVVR